MPKPTTVFTKCILKYAMAKPNTIAYKAVNYYTWSDHLTNKLIFINPLQIDNLFVREFYDNM